MELGKLGVFCFTDALTLAQLTELAQQTERLGCAALWYPVRIPRIAATQSTGMLPPSEYSDAGAYE
jgi:hypothetical protein